MTLQNMIGLWVNKLPELRKLVNTNNADILNFNVNEELIYHSVFIVEDGRTLTMSYDCTNISMRQAPVGVVATLTKMGDDGLASEIQSYYVGMRQKQGPYPASVDIDEGVLEMTRITLQYHDKTFTNRKDIIFSIPKLQISAAA